MTRFESLPNEILITVFEYINARDLYRAFYNLNHRLNDVLQSLRGLYLFLGCIRFRHDIHDALFASRVDTIIVDRTRVFDDFSLFSNVRRLIFLDGSKGNLFPIIDRLSWIEHLSIQIQYDSPSFSELYRRIFSNEFPNLKSGIFNKFEPIDYQDHWQTTPTIRYLRLHSDHSFIHISVLTACVNLHSLYLGIPTLSSPPSTVSQQGHMNLKRLTIFLTSSEWPEQSVWKEFFRCVPHLQRLRIERTLDNCTMMNHLKKSDWLGDVLANCLSCLERFHLILNIRDKQGLEKIDLNSLKSSFDHVYHHRYQFQLIIN